jgi:hypothetical protein
MVLAEYNTLTINAGVTLSTNVPCRGLFIYVKGNCVINGTISMTGKGAYANPASTSSPTWGSAGSDGNLLGSDGLRLGLIKSGSTESLTNDGSDFNGCGTAVRTSVALQGNIASSGKIYKIARTGAAGATSVTGTANVGIDAVSGQSSFQTGGGGGGGAIDASATSGTGAAGTCWTGGSGGAGVYNNPSSGEDATAYGGPAGSGDFSGNAGGAGNPGGIGNTTHGGTGETGTGGTVWLIVGGTLSGSGSILAQGKNGGPWNAHDCGGGGGSGGGSIIVASVADTSSITMNTNGGLGTVVTVGSQSRDGGDGGVGYQIKETGLTGASTYTNLTLQSTDTAAEAAPTKADMVMLMEDTAGTATINTDIKGYVSRDSGATFIEGTLVDEGDWGTNKRILAFHDLSFTGASGTAMCYKITTHNQSASKETKIHATSIGWK